MGVIPVTGGPRRVLGHQAQQSRSSHKMVVNDQEPFTMKRQDDMLERLDALLVAFWRKLGERQAATNPPVELSPTTLPPRARIRGTRNQKRHAKNSETP
ncbi:Hypothetical predicted protein [Pelobates cultripes]|uniref:Uncharacterized protein n=1 Tax=Pelobates cultripes TaxID=61616 RepID=A0AAD1W0C2_PELCU|nr:Hypothetical predicted protein [Pelobates cultripes]